MIQAILDRLALVDGATVREGFYVQSVASEKKFIFCSHSLMKLVR